MGEIDRRNEALNVVIRAARLTQGDGTAAYLTMMGVRLLEMHRVLKQTGSIYLHCDPTASHYLKASLDAIFGKDNFRNELVWFYKNASRGKKQWARSHDILLWYSKDIRKYTFNREAVLIPFESGMTAWRYSKGGQAGKPMPKGKTPDDVITMPSLNTMDKERTGWATQKPLALLNRIIRAGSNPGDLVLDPFAGCATCCVAAEMEDRQWIGIEACENASDIIQVRLDEADLGRLGTQEDASRKVTIQRNVPRRTDDEGIALAKEQKTKAYKTKENLDDLYGKQRGHCNGCGTHYHWKDFHHDHITPQVKDGGHELENLQLLCGNCNSTKHANSMERLWERLYERELPISPAGWKYLKQRGCKDWRIA